MPESIDEFGDDWEEQADEVLGPELDPLIPPPPRRGVGRAPMREFAWATTVGIDPSVLSFAADGVEECLQGRTPQPKPLPVREKQDKVRRIRA